jgi:hypothetical protein
MWADWPNLSGWAITSQASFEFCLVESRKHNMGQAREAGWLPDTPTQLKANSGSCSWDPANQMQLLWYQLKSLTSLQLPWPCLHPRSPLCDTHRKSENPAKYTQLCGVLDMKALFKLFIKFGNKILSFWKFKNPYTTSYNIVYYLKL